MQCMPRAQPWLLPIDELWFIIFSIITCKYYKALSFLIVHSPCANGIEHLGREFVDVESLFNDIVRKERKQVIIVACRYHLVFHVMIRRVGLRFSVKNNVNVSK